MNNRVRFLRLISVLAGLGLLTGCWGEQEPAAKTTAATPEVSAEISWFEGSVEQAFAQAESAGKPLFLYWGAEWCPPCHYLNNKIFKRHEFLQKMDDWAIERLVHRWEPTEVDETVF